MQDRPQPNRRVRSLDGFVQNSTPKPTRMVRATQANTEPSRRSIDSITAPKLSASQLSNYLRAEGPAKQAPKIGAPQARSASHMPARPLSNNSAAVRTMRPMRTPLNAASNTSAATSSSSIVGQGVDEPSSTTSGNKRGRFGRNKTAKIKKIHKHPRLRKVLLSTGGVMGALVLLVGGFLAWKFFNNTGKVFGGNIISNIGALVNSTPLKGQESGRVNILLAGNSADDVGHDGAALTDSIMVVSIDTDNNKAFMLSIPRDFWVNIPGVGYRKINEANYWGDENSFSEDGYPEGGMGLLEKTIEENLELDINYYALINYGAFKDTVNAVGGISVNIESSDPRGLYDPTFQSWEGGALKLSNGVHELDGNTALKLARARGHDGGYGYATSDFTRTENQRKMLLALKDKALSAGTISNPLKIGNLLDSIGDNVKTDFKLNEVVTLADFGKKIKEISSLSFQDDKVSLLSSYTSPTGQSALIPSTGVGDYTEIIAFLKKNMSSDPVVQEGATVTILNGTETDGLASKQQSVLAAKGMTIESVAGAVSQYEKTTIIAANNSLPATKAYLQTTYKGATITTQHIESVPEGVDFVIILGSDFATKQAASSAQ